MRPQSVGRLAAARPRLRPAIGARPVLFFFAAPALLLALLLSLFWLPTPAAAADTLTVCATGATFTTIQDAVDNAESGDVIDICAGTYAESVDLSSMGSAVGGEVGDLTLAGSGVVNISPSSGFALGITDNFTGSLTLIDINATALDASAISIGDTGKDDLRGSFTMLGGSASNSFLNGLAVYSAMQGVTISGTTFTNNALRGAEISSAITDPGCTLAGTVAITVVNSTASQNGSGGFALNAGGGNIVVDSSEALTNTGDGFAFRIDTPDCPLATVFLRDSRADGNVNPVEGTSNGFDVMAPGLQAAGVAARANGGDGLYHYAPFAAPFGGIVDGSSSSIDLSTAATNGGDGFHVEGVEFVTITAVSAISNSLDGLALDVTPALSPQSIQAVITVPAAQPSVANSLFISNNIGVDIFDLQLNGASVSSAGSPAVTALPGAAVAVSTSMVCANLTAGLASSGSISRTIGALTNFWGAYNGPYHEIKNPAGLGNQVIDAANPAIQGANGDVVFSPFVSGGIIMASPQLGVPGAEQALDVFFQLQSFDVPAVDGPGDPNNGPLFTLATDNGLLTTAYGSGPSVPAALAGGAITATLVPSTSGVANITLIGPCGLELQEVVDVASPTLAVTKSPPAQAILAGSEVTFTVDVTNTGDVGLVNVAADDPASPTCSRTLDDLAAGASTSYTCTAGPVNASFTNQITVTANPDVLVPSSVRGPSAAVAPGEAIISATDSADVFVVNPSVVLAKTVGTDADACGAASFLAVPTGLSVYYCLTITNTGDVTFTDHLIADPALGILANLPQLLPPGASVVITRATLPALGPVLAIAAASNTAAVTSTGAVLEVGGTPVPDLPVEATASATADVQVFTPGIAASKLPAAQAVATGGDVTFTIAVTNTGATDLVNIVTADPLAPNCSQSLADLVPGQADSFTCTLAGVTASFTNQVTVTAVASVAPVLDSILNSTIAIDSTAPVTQVLVSTVANADVLVISPSIAVTKRVGLDPDACGGDFPLVVPDGLPVYYCIVVTNTGDVTLTDHLIEDAQLGIATSLAQVLPPAASAVITRSLIPALGPVVSSGAFENNATVTSSGTVDNVGGVSVSPIAVEAQGSNGIFVLALPTGLEVSKSPAAQAVVAGDSVTFTIAVTNTGETQLSNVVAIDPSAPDCSRTLPDLLPGGTDSYICTLDGVTAAFTNQVTVTADASAPVIPTAAGPGAIGTMPVTAMATADVLLVNPSISVIKSAGLDPDACGSPDPLTVAQGEPVYYCITILNTGDVTLTDHLVSDPALDISTSLAQPLAPGAAAVITRRVLPALGPVVIDTPVNNDVAVFSSGIVAAVRGTPVPPFSVAAQDSGSMFVLPLVSGLEASKSPAAQAVAAGGTVNFTIAVTNTGETQLSNVVASDPLAPGCSRTLPDLLPGASDSYICSLSDVAASFTNHVIVTADASAPVVPPTAAAIGIASVPVSATATALVLVVNPSIGVIKSAGTDPDACAVPGAIGVPEGESVYYCLTIINTGDVTFTNHLVSDSLLDIAEVLGLPLPPGATAVITRGVLPGLGPVVANSRLANVAAVTSSGVVDSVGGVAVAPLDVAAGAEGLADVITFPASVAISKDPPVQAVVGGGMITFTISVTNTGGSPLADVTASDPAVAACSRVLGSLDPGASAVYTCSQSGVAASYTNQITVTGTAQSVPISLGRSPSGASAASAGPVTIAAVNVSATAAADVLVVNPGIALLKSVGTDPDTCAPAGPITVPVSSSVFYCFTVTNTGDVTLTNHLLTDAQLGINVPLAAPLPPAVSVVITHGLLPQLGPIVVTSALTNVATITSGSLLTAINGIPVPPFTVQTQALDRVAITLQPTSLEEIDEPAGAYRLYLPVLQR